MNKFDQIQALLGLTEKEKSQILSINMANNPSRLYKEVCIGLGGTQSIRHLLTCSIFTFGKFIRVFLFWLIHSVF